MSNWNSQYSIDPSLTLLNQLGVIEDVTNGLNKLLKLTKGAVSAGGTVANMVSYMEANIIDPTTTILLAAKLTVNNFATTLEAYTTGYALPIVPPLDRAARQTFKTVADAWKKEAQREPRNEFLNYIRRTNIAYLDQARELVLTNQTSGNNLFDDIQNGNFTTQQKGVFYEGAFRVLGLTSYGKFSLGDVFADPFTSVSEFGIQSIEQLLMRKFFDANDPNTPLYSPGAGYSCAMMLVGAGSFRDAMSLASPFLNLWNNVHDDFAELIEATVDSIETNINAGAIAGQKYQDGKWSSGESEAMDILKTFVSGSCPGASGTNWIRASIIPAPLFDIFKQTILAINTLLDAGVKANELFFDAIKKSLTYLQGLVETILNNIILLKELIVDLGRIYIITLSGETGGLHALMSDLVDATNKPKAKYLAGILFYSSAHEAVGEQISTLFGIMPDKD